jgi:streptogramin lyase
LWLHGPPPPGFKPPFFPEPPKPPPPHRACGFHEPPFFSFQSYYDTWSCEGDPGFPKAKPPPCPGGQCGNGGSSHSGAGHSQDPNDLLGPAGFGGANFIALHQGLGYTIRFENEAQANLPAQVVIVTQQLDPNLDWSTFQLGDFGFGNIVVHVPAGRIFFNTRIDVRDTLGVLVDVTANFDVATGIVQWVFTSLDPQTLDVPDDPLAGFLPPNQNAPEGEGFVSYTVRPLSHLVTGTVVNAQATVIFDVNQPINTPLRFNTIDALPPTSTVSPLPPDAPPNFVVSWSGADDPGGSGLASFDVLVSDNGGPFVPWLTDTTQTRAIFSGVFGHTYAFYSVTTDNAGNREAAPSAPEATTVADLPDTATHFGILLSANPVAAGTAFMVTVTALDDANHVVPGYTGTVHFSSSDGLALLPGDYLFTAGDNGVHIFTVTLFTAGSQTLTVTDTQSPSLTGAAGTITELPLPTANSGPNGIVLGPDGNLWFVEATANQIGRVNPDGTISEFAVPTANSQPMAITVGPDGNLWFTEFNGNRIGQVTPSGVISEFLIPTANSEPLGITLGPDGNLWFTEFNANQIGRIAPNGTIAEFALPTAGSGPWGITAGPDGNLWFTEFNANQIGRITVDGSTITEFSLPTANSGPEGITAGPDGYLWFTEFNANQIGSITPDGATLTEFAIATLDSGPATITVGPDRNLWFTETNGNQIAQITPGGFITEFPIPTDGSSPVGITVGQDGNLWFTESQAGAIGQLLVGVTVTPGPIPPPGGGARIHTPLATGSLTFRATGIGGSAIFPIGSGSQVNSPGRSGGELIEFLGASGTSALAGSGQPLAPSVGSTDTPITVMALLEIARVDQLFAATNSRARQLSWSWPSYDSLDMVETLWAERWLMSSPEAALGKTAR